MLSVKNLNFFSPVSFVCKAHDRVNWLFTGVADIDADGYQDVLMRNGATGANQVWLMTRLQYRATATLPAMTDLAWRIGAVTDYNRDGFNDIVWRNHGPGAQTSAVVVWTMNRAQFLASTNIGSVPDTAWEVVGPR